MSKIFNRGDSNLGHKPHRLRNAFIFEIMIAFTGLVVVFIFAVRHLEQSHIEQRLAEEFRIAKEGISTQESDTKKLLAVLSHVICSNSEVQQLWLERDRDKLLAHIVLIYENMFQMADVTHLYFHTPDGINFLRAHRPPSFGDKVARATFQKAKDTENPSYGIEIGRFGTLTYRYVYPWHVDGELVGYLELGKDIDGIFSEATNLLEGSSVVLLNKENLIEKEWKEGMEFLRRSGDWDQYRDYVVVCQYPLGHSQDFVTQLLAQEDSSGQLPSGGYCHIGGKILQIGAIPLKDVSDHPVGYFVFERDVTDSFSEMERSAKILIMSIILIAALIIFFGARMLSKVEKRINSQHKKVEKQLAMESLQSNIIKRFVDYDPKMWEMHIHQSLQDVCKFFHASSVYTIGHSASDKALSDIYGWSTVYGTKGRAFLQELQYHEVQWWIETLDRGKPIVMTGDAIPPEADVPQKLYSRFQTKSILVVPMVYSGKVRGCLIVSHRKEPMDWQPEQICYIGSIANILATSIMRQHVEASAQEYTEKLTQKNIRLKIARTEAEEAAKTKSQFLANMSHEIRTPMTAILGFAEHLTVPIITDEERLEAANTICRNGKHLLQLINDILDFSKVEAGQIKLEKIEFPPAWLVTDVVSLMAKRAEEKGIFLECEFLGSMPQECEGDPTRLKQILLNLVGNAIKFTERGGVTISAKMGEDEEGEGLFVCEVNDTGIGMDEKQLVRVFEPFTQADTSVVRRYGGTGLGLAISRRIAEAMGGVLQVESTKNVSTTFRLVVPVDIREGTRWIENPTQYRYSPAAAESTGQAAKESTGQAAKESEGIVPYKILLVEDGKDNQRLFSLLLSKEGATVEIAENGNEAIPAVEQAEMAGEPFDLILMDMQMPVLDGYDATRQLRQSGVQIPIIALTASVMPGDRSKCIDAGCNDYVSKPINRETLFESILKNLGKDLAVLY